MDYLYQVGSYFKVFKKEEKPKIVEEDEEMSKLDGCLNYVYKVICWEDPSLTWISFICVNILYALLIYLEVRFYCAVFTIAALAVALDYFEFALEFKNAKRYIYLKDITDYCSSFMYNMHLWKRDNPSLFCGVMTTFFLFLSFIGRTISGRLLIYLIILGIYFGPTLIKLAPPEVQNAISQFNNLLHNSDVVNENELMPIVTENFDDDINDETTQDSFTTSLISGITAMPPSIEEDSKDMDETDFLPHQRRKRQTDTLDYSSDSDSDDAQLHFDAKHFVRDSSTSDEDNYVRGIKGSDIPDPSAILNSQNLAQTLGMVSNLAAVGSNLLSNFTSSFTSQPKRRDSSDNSDFEFVNKDDTIIDQ